MLDSAITSTNESERKVLFNDAAKAAIRGGVMLCTHCAECGSRLLRMLPGEMGFILAETLVLSALGLFKYIEIPPAVPGFLVGLTPFWVAIHPQCHTHANGFVSGAV